MKAAESRNKIGKRKTLQLLGTAEFPNEAGSTSAIMSSGSTEVFKRRHEERKFTGGCEYDLWIQPNERGAKKFRDF